MELSGDMKKQLMAMAGISDVHEFDKLVQGMVPQAEDAMRQKNRHSPFQLPFIKMLSAIESKGLDAFQALNKDLEKQVEYVFDLINALPEFVDPNKLLQERDGVRQSEDSKVLRDTGNKHYQKKALELALQAYSASILAASLDQTGQGRDAALGLGNRSAVFFELKAFDRCLEDIEAAKEFGFPPELEYKLHDRRARCLQALGFHVDARQAFQECQAALAASSLKPDKRNELKGSLDQVLKEMEKLSGGQSPVWTLDIHKPVPCPIKIWEHHPRFPHISDALNIVFKENQGRHIIATRNIEVGEAVVIEEPISSHLSPYKMGTNCTHCLRSNTNSVLPSPWLKKARFCGYSCWKQAIGSYHPVESKLDISEIFYGDDENSQLSGCISLAYRAVTQRSLDYFVDNRQKLFTEHDKLYGTNVPETFSYQKDEHYRGLFNLVTHYDQMSVKERLTITIRSVVLLKCLKKSGYFGPKGSGDLSLTPEERFIGSLFFHFQCGIQYNLHTIYQVDGVLEPSKKIPLRDIGAGVYPTTLFFNHSCAPNTIRVNQGPRVIIITKRLVKAGEEVTDCYGIHHMSIPKVERLETLRRGYAFDCACVACQYDYPLLGDLPKTLSPQNTVKLGNSLGKFQKLFQEGKHEKALKICQDYLKKLEEMKVPFPHRNYEIAVVALCSSLWAMAKDC